MGKANPISASTPSSTVSGGGIDAAASKLSDAAYPFMQSVDWTSALYSKPIPGADPQKVTKAIGKMISMGSAADGAGLEEVFASVPTSKVMDVYNAVGGVVGTSAVPNKLFSTVDANAANAAYNALLEFKDVVKAAQR